MEKRRRMVFKIWVLGLIFQIGSTAYAQDEALVINEFMALNTTILADEDGDFSDWIEIYNGGSESLDLTAWTLSDDSADPKKWSIPAVELSPGGFLLVFASGKDRTAPAGELHANFKLSGAGEYLALFNPQGEAATIFEPSFPVQQAEASYGLLNEIYIFFSKPTPGAENVPEGAVLPPPQISRNHGIYNNPFDLDLFTVVEKAEIYYSLDGSTPSIDTGWHYTVPLHIDTTTILRSVLVLDDTLYSEVLTSSYIFLDDVIHQPNNPPGYPSVWGPYTAIEGISSADYEMDPEMMADPAFTASVKEGLESLPTMSLVTDIDNLFSDSTDPETGGIYIYTGPPINREDDGLGKGWERPASVEYFDIDGKESFQVNCGMRLQGGHSRRPEKSPKHSFRLVFKSEYGPSKLHYPLFKEKQATTYFDNLILRAGFGLSWIHHSNAERIQAQYQQDIWSKDTQQAMGHPSSHSRYVHLFLNGIYWGVYAPSERMDSDFAASYMDGSSEDFDVIKDYQDVADGDITSWNKLMEMANAGLESNKSYQQIQGNNFDGTRNPEIESMVDVVNLADYMLLNFYGGNTDWDHHNWAAMRNRVNPGRGFKFFSWDAEHLLKSVSQNVLGENNNECPSRVFQQLRQNEAFRVLFADRVQRYCFNGGLLTPEAAAERWSARTAQVEKAIPAESARWGDYRQDVHPFQTVGPFDLYGYDDYWLPQHNFMLQTYFPQRTAAFLNQLRSAGLFPALDAPQFYIDGNPFPGAPVSKGAELTMSSSQGVIYYTFHGKDPADWGFLDGGSGIELIARDAVKYVKVPKSDLGKQWNSDPAYDHSSWGVCSGTPGGIGYEIETGYEDLISFDVTSAMNESGTEPNNSCYIRIPFTISSGALQDLGALSLDISYDDGFVAFLNGIRVAEVNAPFEPLWNSASTGSHEAGTSEIFDISEHIGLLSEGENLLAIQALNQKISSSDFLLMLELKASDQLPSGISDQAIMYDGAVTLDHSSHIVARTYLDGEWSTMMNSFISFPEDYKDIKVTEIHYNPKDADTIPGSEFEFVELKNTGISTLDLGGLSFVDGVAYTFSTETELIPGGFLVLASSEKSFYDRYGFFPEGVYDGNLNNKGEWITLEDLASDTLFDLLYDNQAPWPLLADGSGPSLVPVEFDPAGDQNGPMNWRNSYHIGGSPGEDDLDHTEVEKIYAESPGFKLGQNYPNPFGDRTYVGFNLPVEAELDLSVFNLVGQKVALLVSGRKPAGHHVVSWNGADDSGNPVEGGIYFYRIIIRSQEGNYTLTRKMIRL